MHAARRLLRNSLELIARHVFQHFVVDLRDERSLEQTIELVKIKTRQFAKRQMTWFRGQLDLTWLSLSDSNSVDSVAEQIISAYKIPAP
jgi:tRNA A37 N6-isopentenylltransferase MiaA